MKRRLFFPLIVCALALAGCYRQAEEPIQQVSGSEAESRDVTISSSTPVAAVEAGEAGAAIDATALATSAYITPEALPGQVEQPTIVLPTTVTLVPAGDGVSSTRVFTLPTPTFTFEEQLDADDECVYSVLPGDTLYRLSIVYTTTVEAFFEVNQLDSDALSIGQLLLIPGCESTDSEEPAAELSPAPLQQEGPVVTDPEEIVATVEPTPMLLDGKRIHVVSAGETWGSIALRYDRAVEDILSANDLAEGAQLSLGQELVIPDEAVAEATEAATEATADGNEAESDG